MKTPSLATFERRVLEAAQAFYDARRVWRMVNTDSTRQRMRARSAAMIAALQALHDAEIAAGLRQ